MENGNSNIRRFMINNQLAKYCNLTSHVSFCRQERNQNLYLNLSGNSIRKPSEWHFLSTNSFLKKWWVEKQGKIVRQIYIFFFFAIYGYLRFTVGWHLCRIRLENLMRYSKAVNRRKPDNTYIMARRKGRNEIMIDKHDTKKKIEHHEPR